MKTKILIKDIIVEKEHALLEVDQNQIISNLKASGQMLVDSDSLSFIYLMEKEDSYIYISIPEIVWKQLKKAVENKLPIYLSNRKDQILMSNIHDEIVYLVENIKGNSNYGKEMMDMVESVFE